jgi:hypothetical protein
MATTLVKEIYDGAGGGSVSSDGAQTSLPRRFLVEFDTASYKNLNNACYATAGGVTVPAIGALYDTGSNFKVRGYSPEWVPGAEGKKVLVTVNYGLPATSGSGGGVIDPTVAPWERAPIFSITPLLQPVERGVDLDGNAVVTTAGVPDQNGLAIKEPQRRLVITFAKLASAYTPSAADILGGTVNSTALTVSGRVMAKWCGRLDRIEHPLNVWVNPSTQAQSQYYEVLYEFTWISANTNKLPASGVIIANTSGLSIGADMGLRFEARPNMGLIQKLTVGGVAHLSPCITRETLVDGTTARVDYRGREILRPATQPMYLHTDGYQLALPVTAADIRWRVYTVAFESAWTNLQIPVDA